jgi:glucokinase
MDPKALFQITYGLYVLTTRREGQDNGCIINTVMQIAENPDSRLAKMAEENGRVSGRTAFDAMREGCPVGQAVVDKYVFYLAAGLTNMVNIFQPEVLCIGGGVCGEGDYLLKPLTKNIRRMEYGSATQTKFCQIKIAELGNDAGIIGAALLGL